MSRKTSQRCLQLMMETLDGLYTAICLGHESNMVQNEQSVRLSFKLVLTWIYKATQCKIAFCWIQLENTSAGVLISPGLFWFKHVKPVQPHGTKRNHLYCISFRDAWAQALVSLKGPSHGLQQYRVPRSQAPDERMTTKNTNQKSG